MSNEPLQYIINLAKYTYFVATHLTRPLKELKAAKLFFLEAKVELTDECYRQNEMAVDQLYEEFYDDIEQYDWSNPRSRISIDEELEKTLAIENLVRERKLMLSLEQVEALEKEEIAPIEVRRQAVIEKIANFSKQNNLPKLAA
jgi:hypothetical protein